MKPCIFLLMVLCCALLGSVGAMSLDVSVDSDLRVEVAHGRYWISSTGKTHNSVCRYYNNCKGYFSDTPSGVNCKLCGGARRH